MEISSIVIVVLYVIASMNTIVFSLVDHSNKRLDKSDAGSLGAQISLVSFDASLQNFFDPNVFNFKLAF